MSSFHERTQNGDTLGAIQFALVYGSLWAIGSSWATAIHEITRAILPLGTINVVIAELLASGVTTLLGIGISIIVTRKWCDIFRHCTPVGTTDDDAHTHSTHSTHTSLEERQRRAQTLAHNRQ